MTNDGLKKLRRSNQDHERLVRICDSAGLPFRRHGRFLDLDPRLFDFILQKYGTAQMSEEEWDRIDTMATLLRD